MNDNIKPLYYFPFTDEFNEDNIIVYVRDEDKVPVVVWNFFKGEDKVGFLHTLFNLEDESGEHQGQGSIIKKVYFTDDFSFDELKEKVKDPQTPIETYDLFSLIKEEKVVNLFDDEYFIKRTNLLNTLIDTQE